MRMLKRVVPLQLSHLVLSSFKLCAVTTLSLSDREATTTNIGNPKYRAHSYLSVINRPRSHLQMAGQIIFVVSYCGAQSRIFGTHTHHMCLSSRINLCGECCASVFAYIIYRVCVRVLNNNITRVVLHNALAHKLPSHCARRHGQWNACRKPIISACMCATCPAPSVCAVRALRRYVVCARRVLVQIITISLVHRESDNMCA